MPAIRSEIDPRSPEFEANAAQMRALVDDLKSEFAKVAEGGGEKARAKHTERGKLLPRERIAAILDPGNLRDAGGRKVDQPGLAPSPAPAPTPPAPTPPAPTP